MTRSLVASRARARLSLFAFVLLLASANLGPSVVWARPSGALVPTAALERAAKPLRLTPRQRLRHGMARAKLLVLRAMTLPAHAWPFTSLTRVLAHGEPFAGVSPQSATRHALRVAEHRGAAVVVGRLAPSLKDVWSVRGAERSFIKLVDELAAAQKKTPALKSAVAFDPDSLGYTLDGVSEAEREARATAAMLRIGQHAKAKGIGVEIDVTTSAAMPATLRAAHQLVESLRVPVRLAIAARYRSSDRALTEWVALARRTGVRLGVRLVKGSYVENSAEAINLREPLLAHYRQLVSRAIAASDAIDVGVASHNEGIWQHARAEARRFDGRFTMHVIRGVNPEVQAKMRAAGEISHEYISYGMDAPVFGLEELIDNHRVHREVVKAFAAKLD